MFAQERHRLIIDRLNENKTIRTSELIEAFGVSFETIRRDLEYLESKGLLQRVHGGAILRELDYSHEIPLPIRESIYREEKSEIARIAARYVEDGMSVALDVSTTNTWIAKELKARCKRLTIITNSLVIANELISMPDYTLILIGGTIRHEEQSLVGGLAEEFAARFYADLFLMSLSGVTLKEGITDNAIGETQIKKIMHTNAKRTIALADSSKFEQISLIRVCGCEEVERFVTDSRIDRKLVERYRQEGIEIVYE
ncbi:DeoR/GlpR family DNA-binding transcription regulator [Paenibacillus sp. MSJ-34]|nr:MULTISPECIES: DeoR/GlpR family DNA-binding transcription regulator [unclassified Paenibacillus]MBU5441102.1 DeoR/GlpR family DNA-binding transcription regulator [Paenibacillus sp. MSJ-34]